jgi:hypothetical protein
MTETQSQHNPLSEQPQGPPLSRQEQEIEMATALMSVSGPCRVVGDVYLSCVATAGLGMCRTLRAQFEQCANESAPESREMLNMFSQQACAHIGDDDQNGRLQCGAQLVMQQVLSAGQQRQPDNDSSL